MFSVDLNLNSEASALALGPAPAQSDDRAAGAAWVIADLVFQLLIIFALGMTEGSPIFKMFRIDRSAVRGPETPSHEKELRLRVFLIEQVQRESLYRVIIYTNLDNRTRSDDFARGIDELGMTIRRRFLEAKKDLEKERGLRVVKTFLAPRDATHEVALRCYADLQSELGDGWLMGAYSPELLGKLVDNGP